MKLREKFTAGELLALDQYLASQIIVHDIADLRLNPVDYLICSTLTELYLKIHAKVKDIQTFPTRKTDHQYPLAITRNQALAIMCTVPPDGPDTAGIATYEDSFLIRLIGRIYQEFLI